MGRAVPAIALGAIAYLGVLAMPAPLFAYAVAGRSIVLHSDAPLPPEAQGLVDRSEALARRSPLFDPARTYDVYLCASRWRWRLLSFGNSRAAAITLPVTGDVIVREGHVERNRTVQASGQEEPGERTLDYVVAHEVTHAMTADFLGPLGMYRLPAWVREGYADYVGRGSGFDFADARAALVGGPRDPARAQGGQYLTYTLLSAQLLEREGWTVPELLIAPPDRRAVEARVRAGVSAPLR